MTTRMFGQKIKRREDPRLVTGNGRYVDDLGAGALVAAFVRSPHAHANIVDIDVTDAIDVDGVVAIWTHEDLPGDAAERLPMLLPHPSIVNPMTGYALARDHVNFVGEPVAMVVAENRYIAEDAAGRISVDYEFLPPVVGVDQARAAQTAVHEGIEDNVAAHYQQTVGDAPGAIASAPHSLELELEVSRSACMPMEGKGVVAKWNTEDGTLLLHSSTQTASGLRAAIAAKLGLPLTKVEVVAPDIGGGFGVKINHPWPEELACACAARALGTTVKWTEDRREHFVSSAHERGQIQEVHVGFDDEGRILGLDVKFWHDNGAYLPYGVIVPLNTSTHIMGPYDIANFNVEWWSLYTNCVIVTPYRGAGRVHATFMMERTMDAIADELGLDRAQVRLNNFVREFPHPMGVVMQDGAEGCLDSGDFLTSLDKLKALVGWDEFEDYRNRARAEGRHVGIGMGAYVESTGAGPYEGGHIEIESSGRVNVWTGLTTQGQAHATVFAQIVADELGVPIDTVHVTTGDTRKMPYSVGTWGSRGGVMAGNALHVTAKKVKAKALKIAGDLLEVSPEDLEIVDGTVQVKGDPSASMPLASVAVLSNPLRYAFDESAKQATQFAKPADPNTPPIKPGEEPGLEEQDYFSPLRSTVANGMHAAIVETDPETADITILKYCVVHDCGPMINPMVVEGQVHGGVAQGVGGALYEKMAYDADGQLLNASFMDFLMPFASEVPKVETDHLETPSPLNPLGIKGAGEAGAIPVVSVIASAIEDAEGFEIRSMPIDPSTLWELRRKHAAGAVPSLHRA
ncbi:aerobic carbon-monoxide dehydrogenase large subunit [Brevibacterium sp. 50QC2O2]|uniref:aerobic carbon-monoxide dehydrogenase large subunit n=1 Tax=unclassified Brevibacterium TaxID=2614124 RepID=UPI00211C8565|nr:MULTISPECIES: aerobic carbon-monoxide dehydrogenase large subunit [unclassified Brevibacterium]MCQ9368805.1 aerobic carbon-monoxide dehydrogenase large subunit [Brevibacterium sp. 91QC2O2]MCQ9388550.1 aerobic carbon-monoxide dehydrogenase large subunit [Brevibacterium sp. 50QC2O2]